MTHAMKVLAACFACGLLAGCVKPGGPGPAPVTSLSSSLQCAPAPSVATSQALVLNPEGKESPLKVSVSESSPCWQTETGNSLYTSIELPDTTTSYMVSVDSLPSATGIFAPQLFLMDAKGKMLRSIGEDKMFYRGAKLTAKFRPHPDEKYLVVASNPKKVGQEDTQVVDGVYSTMVYTGTVFVPVVTGNSGSESRTYSHVGSLVITARSLAGS